VYFQTYGSGKRWITLNGSRRSSVELYFTTTSKKLETTSTGVTVTGDGTFSGNIYMSTNGSILRNTGGSLQLQSDASSVIIRSNNTTALTLDASQNATFAGNVNVNGNATLGNATTDDHIFNGQVTQVTGDALGYKLQRSNGATSILISASSDAELEFGTDNGSGTNTTQWTIGKDGTDNSFRISNSASLGTSDTLTLTGANAAFAGTVTAPTFLGDLNGTINTVTTAVTKANATNDTTVATTAFVQNLIGTIPAGLVFQGTWNAATNTPTLTSGTGTTGNFYIVSVAGTTSLDGITDWQVGDWAVFVEQGASDSGRR
jgi:hypothetical protein